MVTSLPPAAPTHLLRVHTSSVSALSVSSDNDRLYSGDASGLVVVTSTRSLRPIARWNAHTDSLLGIEEWGERIITHARDNKLHVWTRVEELPASQRLGGGSMAQTTSDLPRPELCYSMDVNALNYCRFSLMPLPLHIGYEEPRALIALPNLVDSTSADVWSLPSCERMHAAIGQAGKTSIFNSDPQERSKTGIIMSLHLFSVTTDMPSTSTAGNELRVLCAYESGSVTLRRYARVDKVKSVEGAGWEVIWDAKLHTDTVMAMRVSRKNDLALTVSADHIVGRYDLTDTNLDTACTIHRTKHPGNAAIALRDDGRVCALAGWDGSIRLHATRTMKPLGTLKYHKTTCQAVEFARSLASPDNTKDPETKTTTSSGRDDAGAIGSESEDEDDEEMNQKAKAERARWLIGGGKDNRVSIWALMTFERSPTT